jgi:hypothetical protein
MARRSASAAEAQRAIFLNCPFDQTYRPIFDALVFAAFDCGHRPRCALEAEDSGQARLHRILGIIGECRLGVHDISRVQPDEQSGLLRFNMPFELGLFLGATQFGDAEQRRKRCLVLDTERYRFQRFLSDIAGQDIRDHGDKPERAISALRNWLAALPRADILPGGAAIAKRYRRFRLDLPNILADLDLDEAEMQFPDYANIVSAWLSEQPRR